MNVWNKEASLLIISDFNSVLISLVWFSDWLSHHMFVLTLRRVCELSGRRFTVGAAETNTNEGVLSYWASIDFFIKGIW